MKKKVLLICTVAILILFVPLYESYSYKKEATQKAEQLEKEFIDEFYTRAKINYPIYKKGLESPQYWKDEEDNWFNYNDFSLNECVDKISDLQKNLLTKDSRLIILEDYYKITLNADTAYLRFLNNKSINFNDIKQYIDTVDEVIENYDLPPIASN